MAGYGLALALLIADPVILGTTPIEAGILPEAAVPDETVQGDSDLYNRMTIKVAVQGAGPYRFLIDTGSQRTVVSSALAAGLSLSPGPQVRVVGIAGEDRVATAMVDSIDVGANAFYDLTVPVLEGRHIGADGILGTDSLQKRRVLLDFAHNTIAIGETRELGGSNDFEIIVRAKSRSGRLIMTNAMIDGVSTDVVIDTGASGTVGNRALQRALAERARKTAGTGVTGTIYSVTGHALPVDIVVARRLKLRDLDMGNVVIAFADAPAFGELKLKDRPAIFLGMRELRAFKRVAIDFSTRKVLFDLTEKR